MAGWPYDPVEPGELAKDIAASLEEHMEFKPGFAEFLQQSIDHPVNEDREEWRLIGMAAFNASKLAALQVVPGVDLDFMVGLAKTYLATGWSPKYWGDTVPSYGLSVAIQRVAILDDQFAEVRAQWSYSPEDGLVER
jgi:hypothetical protein